MRLQIKMEPFLKETCLHIVIITLSHSPYKVVLIDSLMLWVYICIEVSILFERHNRTCKYLHSQLLLLGFLMVHLMTQGQHEVLTVG